jgi:hypothetical protein
MGEYLLCSNCFTDQGLRLDAERLGSKGEGTCLQCGIEGGSRLDRDQVESLAYRFFVLGTIHRYEYGGAPGVRFNEQHRGSTCILVSDWLKHDLRLIEDKLGVGFFPYGPRLWMCGEVEPLKQLQHPETRPVVLQRILREYPERMLKAGELLYRLRKNPAKPAAGSEYDSPPEQFLGSYRLDSKDVPVWYGSQDLEVCIHECRVTIEDDLFVATLETIRDLKLLDLTELIDAECTEFESLDMAVHMLFLAGKHSYDISREIARATRKAGFAGMIYSSYFSLVLTGAVPFQTAYGRSVRRFPGYKEQAKSHTIANVALFGRPVAEGALAVKCINRLALRRVIYDAHFGPVVY